MSLSSEHVKLIPLRPNPALLMDDNRERTLIISDLHIGWEIPLTREGFHVPSQTPKLLKKLSVIIEECRPDSLLILGDVKHTIAKMELEEWRDVPDFFDQINSIIPRIRIIRGNHDGNLEPLLPEDVNVEPVGIIISDVGFIHGHAWPPIEMLGCKSIVMGHLHPVVVFKDPTGFRIIRQVWVISRCDAPKMASHILRRYNVKVDRDPEEILKERFNIELNISRVLVMPSFNHFLGGQAVNVREVDDEDKRNSFIGPILRSGCVDMDESEVYMLDGTYLGRIRQLRMFS